MKNRELLAIVTASAALFCYGAGARADTAAGKAIFDRTCAECHAAADFKGEDVKEIQSQIEKISAGQAKHSKAFKLTSEQVTDVATYMVTGG